MLVAFSPAALVEQGKAKAFPQDSSTLWLRAGEGASVRAMSKVPAHLLRIVLPAH